MVTDNQLITHIINNRLIPSLTTTDTTHPPSHLCKNTEPIRRRLFHIGQEGEIPETLNTDQDVHIDNTCNLSGNKPPRNPTPIALITSVIFTPMDYVQKLSVVEFKYLSQLFRN